MLNLNYKFNKFIENSIIIIKKVAEECLKGAIYLISILTNNTLLLNSVDLEKVFYSMYYFTFHFLYFATLTVKQWLRNLTL